jgi:hypothetical protein
LASAWRFWKRLPSGSGPDSRVSRRSYPCCSLFRLFRVPHPALSVFAVFWFDRFCSNLSWIGWKSLVPGDEAACIWLVVFYSLLTKHVLQRKFAKKKYVLHFDGICCYFFCFLERLQLVDVKTRISPNKN